MSDPIDNYLETVFRTLLWLARTAIFVACMTFLYRFEPLYAMVMVFFFLRVAMWRSRSK